MERPITIHIDGQPYMFVLNIARRNGETVYEVVPDSTYEHFKDVLPDSFSIIRKDGAATPEFEYRGKAPEGKGKEIAQLIWQAIEDQPPQMKGQ